MAPLRIPDLDSNLLILPFLNLNSMGINAKSQYFYLKLNTNNNRHFLFLFYLYIYPPDSQKSDGGAIHRANNYLNLLSEMPRYCCLLQIFYFSFLIHKCMTEI